MGIKYPIEFIQKIRIEYKNIQDVITAAENGDYILGKYLAEGSMISMDAVEIVEAFESGNELIVLEAAQSAVRRRKIHQEWINFLSKKLIGLDKPKL